MELKEKAVSKKQQRFFGMVRAAQKGEGAASPEVAKVAGEISKKDAKDFAKTKHKGLPEKKEVKEGMKEYEALKKEIHSRESGSRLNAGDEERKKTKREKNKRKKERKKARLKVEREQQKTTKPKKRKFETPKARRRRIMRGDDRVPLKDVNKPAEKQSIQRVGGSRGVHTANRKSKAAQGKPAPVVYSYKKKVSEALSVKDAKKFNKASALDQSNDPKDQDRARARRTEVDYKDLLRQINKRKKPMKPAVESFEIDKSAHKTAQKKAKLRNLAKGNTNPNEKAAAEKKAGGPKLIGEVVKGEDTQRRKDDAADRRSGKGKLLSKKVGDSYAKWTMAKHPKEVDEGKTFDSWKKAAASALGRKKEEKKPQKDMSAGGRSRRVLQRREYAAKVSGSEDIVPDEIRN